MNVLTRWTTIVHKCAKTPMDHIVVSAEMAIAFTAMDTCAMVNLHEHNYAIQ